MATTLGIDIGKRSIRGALLHTSLRAHEIVKYLEVPVSALGGDGASDEVAHAAVRELVAQLGAPPDAIVVALDGRRGSLRVVELPQATKKRAHDVLPFELEPLLPFAVHEALVDFQEVGPRGDQVALMAAAIPETVVAETLDTMTRIGIVPRELAMGAASLDGLSMFVTQPPDEVWMLAHLDADHTEIAMLRGGVVELARTVDEGIDGLRTRPHAARAALQQTLMKYRAEGGPLPAKLLVMGEGSTDPLLVGLLGSTLGLPAEPVRLPPTKDGVENASPIFGKALALAGRTLRRGKRIDMRRGKYALPRGVSQLRDYALLAVLCTTAIIFSYVFSVWAEYRVLAQERDALAEKLAQVTADRFGEKAPSVQRARELLEGGGSRKDPLPRFDAFKVLAAVSAAVPAGVQHDTRELEIELDETGQTGKIHLEGQVPDLAARDQVADAMDAHDCLGPIERGKTSAVPGQERKNYTLEGTIACPGAVLKKPKGGKATSKKSGGE